MQGYFGGAVDLVGQRIVEIWAGLPILFLLIILASIIEPNFFWLLGLLVLFGWMSLVGVVRAEFLRARNFDFVRAARALGVPNFTVMAQARAAQRHGRNAHLPAVSAQRFHYHPDSLWIFWGLVYRLNPLRSASYWPRAKNNLQAPWLGLTGFFTLALMLTLLIFVGEAVRDAFDPRRAIQA